MIVGKILKKLTPHKIKKELAAVKKTKLPAKFKKWVREYEEIGERNKFVWKLFLKAKREIDCMPAQKPYRTALEEVNFLITMFVVLLDDMADQSHNEKFLNRLAKIPFMGNAAKNGNFNKKEKHYLNFTLKIWERVSQLINKAPLYKNFKHLFESDINQMIGAINRDCFINNNPCAINKDDYWLYSPHTMQFIIGPAVNLMYLSVFVPGELKIVREIAWQGQKMARVGNCISTWEREVNEGDFSSGVFAYAIGSKTLTAEDLTAKNHAKIIKKIKRSGTENELLKEWEKSYKKISSLAKKNKLKTINVAKFLRGLENLLMLEIISKKYK